jgi:hypothetical protein
LQAGCRWPVLVNRSRGRGTHASLRRVMRADRIPCGAGKHLGQKRTAERSTEPSPKNPYRALLERCLRTHELRAYAFAV